mmetsp:Transcript_81536/g.195603  ORF Transcript_81536/g.195603 Transcript_81536/m.195603 type:complete len:230 (+) Transcript_81536:620-1309(+)
MLAANGFSPEQHAVLDLGPRLFLHHRLRHGDDPVALGLSHRLHWGASDLGVHQLHGVAFGLDCQLLPGVPGHQDRLRGDAAGLHRLSLPHHLALCGSHHAQRRRGVAVSGGPKGCGHRHTAATLPQSEDLSTGEDGRASFPHQGDGGWPGLRPGMDLSLPRHLHDHPQAAGGDRAAVPLLRVRVVRARGLVGGKDLDHRAHATREARRRCLPLHNVPALVPDAVHPIFD